MYLLKSHGVILILLKIASLFPSYPIILRSIVESTFRYQLAKARKINDRDFPRVAVVNSVSKSENSALFKVAGIPGKVHSGLFAMVVMSVTIFSLSCLIV